MKTFQQKSFSVLFKETPFNSYVPRLVLPAGLFHSVSLRPFPTVPSAFLPVIDSAKDQGVEIRTYRVIYECIEEIEAAMKGMLAPEYREVLLGHAEVRQTIRVPNVGVIAGSYIQDGKVTRNSKIRVVRDGVVVFEDEISSLRRFKDDVKEVAQGYECGIGLEKFNDIKVGDILESFIMEEIPR